MKKIFTALSIFMIVSCSKNVADQTNAPTGVYNSTSLDTAFVTNGNGGIIKIRWASLGTGAKINFDSVKLNPDLSFTCNQIVQYFGSVRAIGSGQFGQNTLSFHFVVDGGHVNFTGIKQ